MSNELTLAASNLLPSTFDQCVTFSEHMCKGNLIPAHVKNPADFLRIVLQSARWGMDPIAVAEKTSVISGKLMYEGQLVSAIVNSRGNLASRLNYKFSGEGRSRVLTVSGTIKGESDPREIELSFDQASKINKNGQMNQNPDQQMCYIGARIWARRHMPELILGVYTPDEMGEEHEPLNVTGTGESPTTSTPPLERPAAKPRAAKGAAAAKVENESKQNESIDITAAHVTDPKPKEEEKPEPKSAPAPATPAPEKPKDKVAKDPVRTLAEGETVKFNCTVVDFAAKIINVGGTATPSVVAEVAGEFIGKVYHFGGATLEGDVAKAAPEWQLNKPVEITLYGRKQATTNAVVPTVKAISLAAEEF